jgi:hypothetical protein
MWLFDNLFLDKNTPMAINNGEEHPGDPSQVWGASSPTGGNPPGGDTSATPTAPTPVIEVASAVVSTVSETPTVTPAPWTDNAVSFDIGGDIGFDIGGMPDVSAAPVWWTETSTPTDTVAPTIDLGFSTSMNPTGSITVTETSSIVPSQDASEVPFIVGETTDTLVTESQKDNMGVVMMDTTPLTPEEEKAGESLIITWGESQPQGISVTSENTVSNPEVLASSTASTESPLTNLMWWFSSDTPTTLTTPDTSTNPSDMSTSPVTDTTITPPTDTSSTDALFSLIGNSEEEKKEEAKTETPSVLSDAPTVTLDALTTPVAETPITDSTEVNSVPDSVPSSLISELTEKETAEESEHPMSEVGKELARMTRSPRLQGKLLGFISGLEELSKEEDVVKSEKRKQIESYQLRITELKAEYETRIHALELEEADLKKQIAQMDEEREHLTQVIDGFKKELEVV